MSGEELRRQIYGNLNLKETDELLEIWQVNNRGEWSDQAFESIRDILKERGVEIPKQNEPVYEVEKETADEETPEDNELEEWEAKLLDDENQPEFYDPLEVLTLRDHINKVTQAVIIVGVLQGLTTFQWYRSIVEYYFPNRQEFVLLIYFIASIVTALSITVTIAITYFPLKALAQILRIIMEMEFTSRKGNQPAR